MIEQVVVLSCEELHQVQVVPTIDDLEGLYLETNVGVIVLPLGKPVSR